MSVSESTERNNAAKMMAQKQTGWRANLQILMVLFKSRVVSLLLLAATGGAFLAAGGWPGRWESPSPPASPMRSGSSVAARRATRSIAPSWTHSKNGSAASSCQLR